MWSSTSPAFVRSFRLQLPVCVPCRFGSRQFPHSRMHSTYSRLTAEPVLVLFPFLGLEFRHDNQSETAPFSSTLSQNGRSFRTAFIVPTAGWSNCNSLDACTQKKTIRQLYFKHIMLPLAGDGSTGGVKSRSKSVVTFSFSVENDEFGSMFCNSSNHL